MRDFINSNYETNFSNHKLKLQERFTRKNACVAQYVSFIFGTKCYNSR